MSKNLVTLFVLDVLERGLKTAAQAALLSIGAQTITLNAFHTDWLTVAGFSLGGFILSLITSLASQPIGNKYTASIVNGVTSKPVTTVEPVPVATTADPLVPLADQTGVANITTQ